MSHECLVSATALGSLATTIEEKHRAERTHQVPLVLRLTEPKIERQHVTWAEGTIDNEHLRKLKSNCCCIWVKPRIWDDPTTWEQDEYEVCKYQLTIEDNPKVEHCRGHTLPATSK